MILKSGRLGLRSGYNGGGVTAKAVEDAESWLRHRMLVGAVSHGSAWLGNINTPCYKKAQGKDPRALIQDEV